MPSQTNERAFEALIEKALCGSSREERQAQAKLSEPTPVYSLNAAGGYQWGESSDFDPHFALDTAKFWHFLETTQSAELDKLRDRPNYQRLILERLNRLIKRDGTLELLKKGFSIDAAQFTLFYSPPINEINPLIAERYRQNIFSLTRQLFYSTGGKRPSLDIVLFLNGLPIVTLELKNEWTGQTYRDAEKQYKTQRDPQEPLLQFGRCLVHFAVDTNHVTMTTRLAKGSTYFLPFNKGHNHGQGNPPNPHGHATAYLWQDVLHPDSLANIIEHFVVLMGDNRRAKLNEKTLYFPRYHQRDVVRQLLADLKQHGAGKRYLIQHSAGSGKSNSITWLAYQLIELYQPGADRPLFNSVIVVTDRRVLDRQLSNNIGNFSEVKNIIAHAQSAADLKQHLESGKKIIISTIQKFPFIVDGIDDLSDSTFAVIIDEAHSSQGGKAAMNLNVALGQDVEEEPDDIQEFILRTMATRKMRQNAAYFAFTATPKNATLEKFGVPDADGKNFKPFHLYSMKQAIEEGFILDVLANYTTYKSYYEIEKSIADNPLFDTAKAQKRLRKYVEGHADTIAEKAEVIVEHFLEKVIAPKKLKGQAKGMVLTHNIVTAIRYYWAIQAALAKRHSPIRPLIAFSGKKQVDGIEYTEETLNGFASKEIEENFDSNEYQLLVVANKFLTGFDQPKLTAMYVDKKLQGVLAVQALSRLNRSNNKLGKRPEDLFILDFHNSISEIKTAFDPFYTATSLSEPTDVNILHDLKHALDAEGVYDWHEVEQFNQLYFSNVTAEQLSPVVKRCADRFNQQLRLEDEEKADFKIKAKQFVKIYGQVASILPFDLPEWEMLFWFLKFLIPLLVIKDKDLDAVDELLNSVDLSTYQLERKQLSESIELDATESSLDPQNPNMRGVHDGEEQRDPLDEIIAMFNERWGMSQDKFKQSVTESATLAGSDPDVQAMVLENSDEQNREIAWVQMMKTVMLQQRRQDLSLYQLYAADEGFRRAYNTAVLKVLEEGVG